mmetsp:Transcript_52842/g.153755  ORF Transcript_52842/g.153755 Transcript_52842/m.153755 type:complete len:218 (-) Transcript_52842:8-661(-)
MAPATVGGIVQEAGAWLACLAGPRPPFLVAPGDAAGDVEAGDLEELQLGEGGTRAVKVLAVDTISDPPRARVLCLDTDEKLTVPVYLWKQVVQEDQAPVEEDLTVVDAGQTTVYQDYEDAFSLAREAPVERRLTRVSDQRDDKLEEEGLTSVIRGVREEINATVQDFREKGAVGALRDAALDACDVVGCVANVAAGTARAFAEGARSTGCPKQAIGC